jgi:hypothetical protein
VLALAEADVGLAEEEVSAELAAAGDEDEVGGEPVAAELVVVELVVVELVVVELVVVAVGPAASSLGDVLPSPGRPNAV